MTEVTPNRDFVVLHEIIESFLNTNYARVDEGSYCCWTREAKHTIFGEGDWLQQVEYDPTNGLRGCMYNRDTNEYHDQEFTQ